VASEQKTESSGYCQVKALSTKHKAQNPKTQDPRPKTKDQRPKTQDQRPKKLQTQKAATVLAARMRFSAKESQEAAASPAWSSWCSVV